MSDVEHRSRSVRTANNCGLQSKKSKGSLLDVPILDAVDEELLPLVGWIAGALVKGVSEEEHGIQHHPAGPHIYWPALICLLLPHIGQHFRSCIANDSPAGIATAVWIARSPLVC